MKPTILMVDDEKDYSSIIRSWLEPEHDFHAFEGGEEFLTSLRIFKPDLVILDVYLPGSDGYELCRRLHSAPGMGSVPVLFLTGSKRVEDYHRGMVAGGNSYLMKPVSRPQLLAEIARLLPRPTMQEDGSGD
ncbi:MAG: PleD family two-component system response regulator [Elusimicrobiota bacterium]